MASTMLNADLSARRAVIAITSSLTILSFAAAPAMADRRAPAPIVFAGQGQATSAPRPSTTRPQATNQAKPKKLSRRERRAARRAAKRVPAPAAPSRTVEFRYPDQPEVFYGANGPRAEAGAAPLSFSSGSAAISQADAAKLTVGTPPVQAGPIQAAPVKATPVQLDPAITPGGFDARAAAAKSAQGTPAPSPQFVSAAGPADFTSTPLPEIKPAVVQKPAVQTRPVSGAVFQPVQADVYDKTGTASVFDPALNGQPTANGEMLDTQAMIAAHPSLPLPSLVQVINLENNREIVVRVNDRGPIDGNGLIEVSERAATVLGFNSQAGTNVRVRYLGPAPQAITTNAPAQPEPAVQAQIRPAVVSAPLETPLGKSAVSPLFAKVQAASPASNADREVFVQLASFSDIGNAQRLHATLNTSVQNIGIIPVKVRGTDFFRVVAGPIANRREAEQLRDRLANQGIARGLIIAAP